MCVLLLIDSWWQYCVRKHSIVQTKAMKKTTGAVKHQCEQKKTLYVMEIFKQSNLHVFYNEGKALNAFFGPKSTSFVYKKILIVHP